MKPGWKLFLQSLATSNALLCRDEAGGAHIWMDTHPASPLR
jgi:hypothetical protein